MRTHTDSYLRVSWGLKTNRSPKQDKHGFQNTNRLMKKESHALLVPTMRSAQTMEMTAVLVTSSFLSLVSSKARSYW